MAVIYWNRLGVRAINEVRGLCAAYQKTASFDYWKEVLELLERKAR